MKLFMDDDFLLTTKTASQLYHQCAAKMPVLDYHCHISPKDISEDQTFDNITELWLAGDHYKWRQMRWCGVDEKFITGNAPDREKFQQFAQIMPMLIGNPVYHWSHLELKRYFDFHKPLCADTAQEVWDITKEKLKNTSAKQFITQSRVTLVCTTDDPADSLEHHRQIAEDKHFSTRVLPAMRPEAAMDITSEHFCQYIGKLGEVSDVGIKSFADLKEALLKRMEFFNLHGCKTADHSLDYIMFSPASEDEVEKIFKKALSCGKISHDEKLKYLTAFMLFAAKEYHRLGWVMQIHFGVIRNNNSQMFEKVGANTGFDSIRNYTPCESMIAFLDALNGGDCLPKTILYSLNPGDFMVVSTAIGCFQRGGAAGKIQLGSGWWFYDTKQGMREQMTTLAAQGALGTFIGMLTDSRSFISYPRHEYFRRILCDMIGSWVENGEFDPDKATLYKLVGDICYNNVVNYFEFSEGMFK